jgi:hypothetical protein
VDLALDEMRGRRNAERRTLGNGRGMFPDLGKQRHTATPLSVPPRRLKTLVRSSGDLADPRKGP